MTIREAIQRIQSLYSKGVQSDDSRLSRRHIYNKLITVRQRVVSQEVKKRQKISQWNYQPIKCIEMVEVPLVDCPCVPPIGCFILRSKYQIPNVMVDMDNHLIQSVTSLDSGVTYDPNDWHTVKYNKGNKYTSKKVNYFIRDKYLYLSTTKKPEIITMTALFEDPIVAYNYPSCCEVKDIKCKTIMDEEFPVDGSLIDSIIELSVAELLDWFTKGKEDLTNNSTDNIVNESK